MSRVSSLARTYGFDVLIVVAAIESAFALVLRPDATDAPRTTMWFVVPAVAIVILPLLARQRLPFATPRSSGWRDRRSRSSMGGSCRSRPASLSRTRRHAFRR